MPRRTRRFDALDYQILLELNANLRADAAKISRAIDANERTVHKRIDRLLEMGVVSLVPVVNPHALGYVTMVQVFLEVDPEHEEEVMDRLLSMPEVAYVAYGQDPRECSIAAFFRDNGEMRDFLVRVLPAVPGITMKSSMLIPRILRNTHTWMPRAQDFLSSEEEEDVVY